MIGKQQFWVLRTGSKDFYYWSTDQECEAIVPVWELSVNPDQYGQFCRLFAHDGHGPFHFRNAAIQRALSTNGWIISETLVNGIYRPKMPVLVPLGPNRIVRMPGQPAGLTAPVH